MKLDHPEAPPLGFGFSITCVMLIEQTGDALDVPTTCGGLSGLLGGSFDKETGEVGIGGYLSETDVSINATLSGDGASMSGYFSFPNAPVPIVGSFAASRTDSAAEWWGDGNCDDAVDSIDALLVLQLESKLPVVLECYWDADVDLDGDWDAVDALLILQATAGLLDRLPVVSDA